MARQTSHVIVQPRTRPARKKPAKPRDPVASGERDAAHNRAASHNYFLLEKFEAGVALRGTEVKSIREGKANLKDSYGLIKDGEAFLLNVHIGPYSHGNIANHDETRTRKLLLHREEVRKLLSEDADQGPHAHPHPALLPQRAGQVRTGRGQGQAGLGQARDRTAAAKPTAKPAPPSTPASTAWGGRGKRLAFSFQLVRGGFFGLLGTVLSRRFRSGNYEYFQAYRHSRQVFPGGVGGVNRRVALDGEGQAGAIAEGEAVGAGRPGKPAGNPRLVFIEGDGFAFDFGDMPPGYLLVHAGSDQLGLHLGQIDGADHAPRAGRRQHSRPPVSLRSKARKRRRRGRDLIQATPPSRCRASSRRSAIELRPERARPAGMNWRMLS